MNKGNLNREFLEKNIEQIIFYRDEEKNNLLNIFGQMEQSIGNYKSKNSSQFLNRISELKPAIEQIYAKRLSYISLLNKVIVQYESLSMKTIETFELDKEV